MIQYGWQEELGLSQEAKRARALELLDKFPAVVVVDDIDSVDGQSEDVIEFFSLTVPQTKSKVLFTSRRVIWGMGNHTTNVKGFDADEGLKFVHSRCRLMEIDPKLFTRQTMSKIVEVTEGSPLYIEDLMRLTAVLPVPDAIRTWAEREGNEARKYALGREMEMLSKDAKLTLIAGCVTEGPTSLAELRSITGLSDETLADALRQLQGLFLVPKPRLIEGEARFEINVNVRLLVRETEGKSDVYRRVLAAHRTIGAVPRPRRPEIGALVRQAVLMVRSGDEVEAERLMSSALDKFPNDPDLMGVLGWVYRRFHPPRVTDARQCFQRSFDLKNKNEDMYKHWAKMELEGQDWTKAAEAAERGIERVSRSRDLRYLAGYARSRLAQDMEARLQSASAQGEFFKSLRHLDDALGLNDSGSPQDRDLNKQIYRAKVINCARLQDVRELEATFDSWFKEHPDDPYASSEWERVAQRFKLHRS